MGQSGTFYLKDFASYTPVTDPRREKTPCVINGKNFLFDVDGPRSAFNAEFFNWFQYDRQTRRGWVEFKVESEFWYGTPTGIWRIMPVSLEPELLLDVQAAPLFKYWPWTFAKVGGLYYFAQHDKGLWQYTPSTRTFEKVKTPADVVNGICATYGRLMCLSDTTVFWSALDDGTDLTPSTVTGAGFQPLSMLSAKAFRVDAVADGVIVSTDKGYLKGEFVAAAYIFRWYVLSVLMKPFSPNAGIIIPDIGLLTLDTRGFYVSSGQQPQLWEQQAGEYFSSTFINRMDRRRFGCLSMHFSYAAKSLYVSFAPNEREGSYIITFVYLISSGKWGVFSRTHHGFFEVLRKPFNIETSAYMGVDGYVRALTNKSDLEIMPIAPNSILDFVVRKFEEPKIRIQDGVFTGITDLWWVDRDTTFLAPAVPRSGLFEFVPTDHAETAVEEAVIFESTPPTPPDPVWYVE